jgi:hypothetical protein
MRHPVRDIATDRALALEETGRDAEARVLFALV